MASTGVINGTNFRLYVDGKPLGHATSCTISFSMETRETVDKDSVGGYASAEAGKRSYSISFEGFLSEDTTLNTVAVNSVAGLLAVFNSDAKFAWRATTDVVGDVLLSGSGLMSDFSLTAPVEENGTISGTITGVGAPTIGAVPV
ncbi:phage tail tube protein [Lewinella sp. JB7]|uniref:phage tail tube protein n=1 Tax=Lewinella sp. JB7 TaxID=2962887 RepID=UPI0020C9D19E|nr:phage tail tube protein [Lewinella sp. JB7]MCP9237157.1 phage tail protein [Lewinella sp. JB7]